MNRLPEHPTHDVYDASKIQEYMTCPRKFFFRYILGWVPEYEEKGYHKVFGHALHSALAYLYRNGFDEESVIKAIDVFNKEYRAEYPNEEDDDQRAPKTALNGIESIVRYAERYGLEDQRYEVLHVEISGNVPIDHRLVHFRIDTVLRGKEGVFVLEHKTASRMSQQWADQWRLKFQVGLYSHVLYSLYDPKDVFGVRINGIFLYKSRPPEFLRVPVRMTPERMLVWLNQARHYISEIERNRVEMRRDLHRHTQESFPMNTESCTKYYGCLYLDLCSSWSNPLVRSGEPPTGFKVEWWDPRDEDYNTTEIDIVVKQTSIFDLLKEGGEDDE